MEKSKSGHQWVFVLIMFFFLLLHQIDVVLLVPMTDHIMATFNIIDFSEDPLLSLVLVVGMTSFFIWGYLFDSHSRKKLLSIAGFIWGVTSLLIGIAPTYATFIISNAASGIDNASHSGIYALVGDFFGPRNRGKVLGLLYITQPFAFLFGIISTFILGETIKLRLLFMITAAVGFLMALLIFFFIHEPKRGASEPALADINMTGVYLLDWDVAKGVLKKPSLILVYAFGLFGIIPWFVITSSLFPYLSEVRAVPEVDIYLSLIPSLIAISLGYPLGGLLGDLLFKTKKTGRIIVSMAGVVLPSLFLFFALQSADAQGQSFILLMMLMGLFLSFSWPNLVASVLDIILPEMRASAISIMLLFQVIGALIGPMIVSRLKDQMGLGGAILSVCIGAWVICLVIQIGLLNLIPKDLEKLRRQMAYRSHLEARLERPQKY